MDLSSFRMSKNFLLTTIPILSREQIKTEVSFNTQLKKIKINLWWILLWSQDNTFHIRASFDRDSGSTDLSIFISTMISYHCEILLFRASQKHKQYLLYFIPSMVKKSSSRCKDQQSSSAKSHQCSQLSLTSVISCVILTDST